jgi:signal transduction histidine kinase
MTQAVHPDPRTRRAIRGAVVVAVLAVAAFWTVCVLAYRELREDRIAHARQETQRAVVAIEAHSVRLFDYADSYLRSIRSYYQDRGAGASLRDYIRKIEAPRASTFSGVVTVLDRDGRLVFNSQLPDEALAARGSFAAYDHYQYFQSHPGESLFIGPTRLGGITGKYQFRIARPLLKDGALDGLVVITLLPDQIVQLFRDLSLGPNSVATMLTLDGKPIARVPPLPDDQYDRIPRTDNPWSPPQNQESGWLPDLVSPVDGQRRDVYFKRLPDYPVVVLAGLGQGDYEDALDGPRQNLITLASAFSAVAALVCLLVVRLIRRNSDLVAAEKASREAATLLERSNADLEQFAYAASHDLQTPLRNVAGFVRLLERRYGDKLDDEAREFIGFAVDATKQMSQRIADLLEYSRAAMQSEPIVPVSAEEALAEALGNLAGAIAQSGATVRRWPLPMVMAHGPLLVRLLQNLVDNAIKYRHTGRPLEVDVTAEPIEAGWWRISVRDNGIGIQRDYFEKIFHIFQRLHADSSVEGTGIGLALCKRIVQRFGGTISVDSEPGQGTTFSFTVAGPGVSIPSH